MAVKTRASAQSTILLRRPLPPNDPLSQTNTIYKKCNTSYVERKKGKVRKKELLASKTNDCSATNLFDLSAQDCVFNSGLLLYKRRGPDPLPGRQPRRMKGNPYDLPVERRFLPSLPEFTLEQFLLRCDAQGMKANEFLSRQFIGRSEDTWFLKENEELNRHNELYNHVFDGNDRILLTVLLNLFI